MSKNKRMDILEAALELFAERGYDGTTVPTIADQAQVGAGTIYRYFANKEVLVNSLFQECIQQLTNTLMTNVPPAAAPIRERFKHIFFRISEYAGAHGQALTFIASHSDAPFLNESSREMFEQFLDLIRGVIDEGKEQGMICPLPSNALIAMVYGAMVQLFNMMKTGALEETPGLLAQIEECCWNAIRVH
ncbi:MULTISPECIES: TetR/AcrR family transcriptional regulator [Paenibacillus]|uniref:TetR/AcrR family transcriptional regulator n=1 Tax=Paenibacillus residui TaxID=629724 RepID=A0ABW3D6Z7_9BACL